MTIAWGNSRFAILVGPFAIKLARFRVVWIFQRLLIHFRNGEMRRVTARMKKPEDVATRVFKGIHANRREQVLAEFFSGSPILLPTFLSLFGGLINIQPRGEKITLATLNSHHPFSLDVRESMPEEVAEDLDCNPANFCLYQGKVMILDYGSESTYLFLLGIPLRQDQEAAA